MLPSKPGCHHRERPRCFQGGGESASQRGAHVCDCVACAEYVAGEKFEEVRRHRVADEDCGAAGENPRHEGLEPVPVGVRDLGAGACAEGGVRGAGGVTKGVRLGKEVMQGERATVGAKPSCQEGRAEGPQNARSEAETNASSSPQTTRSFGGRTHAAAEVPNFNKRAELELASSISDERGAEAGRGLPASKANVQSACGARFLQRAIAGSSGSSGGSPPFLFSPAGNTHQQSPLGTFRRISRLAEVKSPHSVWFRRSRTQVCCRL